MTTQWEIEPHTLAKHEILRRYLSAWYPILSTYNPRIVYLDGFCGPGRYKGGEDGSPIIALREALKYSQRLKNNEITFLFVDERADRIAHLNAELNNWKIPTNFHVRCKAGQFNNVLKQLLDDLEQHSLSLAPTFAFIDPFGFKGLPFDLIHKLLLNPKTEVLINIMVDPINRFLEHPDPQTRLHIIDLFGTQKVLEVAQLGSDRITALRVLYQKQLQEYAKFVRYFEMRDDRGKIIYYLFFATNHRLGHVRMKEAFWQVDPFSGFRFSDRTDPNQLILFELDPSMDLAKELIHKFDGSAIQVNEIKVFVEDKTPFTAKHMRNALDLLEKDGEVCVSPCKPDGKKRRKSTFPDDVTVEFKSVI